MSKVDIGRLVRRRPYKVVRNSATGARITLHDLTGARPGDLYYEHIRDDGIIVLIRENMLYKKPEV